MAWKGRHRSRVHRNLSSEASAGSPPPRPCAGTTTAAAERGGPSSGDHPPLKRAPRPASAKAIHPLHATDAAARWCVPGADTQPTRGRRSANTKSTGRRPLEVIHSSPVGTSGCLSRIPLAL